MRIIVITSGTGAKAVGSPRPLVVEDFRRGPPHVAARLLEHPEHSVPAEDLYAGDQHRRLMSGVKAFRGRWPDASPHSLELYILSPGYGLVRSDQRIAPYDASFQGMNAKELREWADHIAVPHAVRQALRPPFDLAFLLLGHAYLAACDLDAQVQLGGCTYAFGGGRAAADLPAIPNLRPVQLGQQEAAEFHCPLFCLKGEIVGGWLARLSIDPGLANALVAGTVDAVNGWKQAS